MLGEVIGKVFGSLLTVQAEFIFLDAAAHLDESYIKVLGDFTVHVAGEYVIGGCAVGLDRGGRLRVAHFDEGCADGNILLAVE